MSMNVQTLEARKQATKKAIDLHTASLLKNGLDVKQSNYLVYLQRQFDMLLCAESISNIKIK